MIRSVRRRSTSTVDLVVDYACEARRNTMMLASHEVHVLVSASGEVQKDRHSYDRLGPRLVAL